MTHSKAAHQLPSFSCIALADILANGVAVLLIMIVINLQVQKASNEALSERLDDVASVLSRDIAKKMVKNALPTSPPARLHDYTRSPIDRFPKEYIMPVLMLTEAGVKHFYSGELWSRGALLSSNNQLDAYLRSLTNNQKKQVRVDVYSIKHFYLLMSILKDHDIQIRHWHFLEGVAGQQGTERPLTHQPASVHQDISQSSEKRLLKGDIPSGVSLQQQSFLNHDLSLKQLTSLQAIESADDQQAKMTVESYSSAKQQPFQLMLATDQEPPSKASQQEPLSVDIKNIVAYLFELLITGQQKAEAGEYRLLEALHLVEAMKAYVYSFPKLSEYRAFMVEKVVEGMSTVTSKPLTIHETQAVDEVGIAVSVNEWLSDITTMGRVGMIARSQSNQLSFRLSLYPSVFAGTSVSLSKDTMIIMPVENRLDSTYKWRLAASFNRQTNQTVIGFLYSKPLENDQLLISADENDLQVGGQGLTPSKPVDTHKVSKRLLFFCLFLSLAVCWLVFKQGRGSNSAV